MEDRGGAPPLNNQVPSEDAQAAQQVTSNQQAGYGQDMEIDSVSGQNVEASANSGAHNHSNVENQSDVQHIHTHPLVHRPHERYSQNAEYNVQGLSANAVSQGVPAAATATQGRQNNHQPRSRYSQNVQPRHGHHDSRKRAYEPDYDYAHVYLNADQKEQRMGVQRLPLDGELLQQEPHDKIRYMNNGRNYKDQLELMGGNQSMVNWVAPDQQAKKTYGLQFVAKVATDDDSLMALVKTIQLEARRQASPIVNLWVQCQDPDEQRNLVSRVAFPGLVSPTTNTTQILTMSADHMPQLASRGVHFGHVKSPPTLSQAHALLTHLDTQVKDINKRATEDRDLLSFIYVVPNQRSVLEATEYLKATLVGCDITRNAVVAQQNTLGIVDYDTVSEPEAVKFTRRTLIVFDLNCGWITASAATSLALVLERIKAMFTTDKTSRMAITCLTVSNTSDHAWSKSRIHKEFQVFPRDYQCQWINRCLYRPLVCPDTRGMTQLDWTGQTIIHFLTHPDRLPSFKKLVVVCPVNGWPEHDAIVARIHARCDRALQDQVQEVFWSSTNARVFNNFDMKALSKSDGPRFTIVFVTSDVRFQQPFPPNCHTLYVLPQKVDRYVFDPSTSHVVKTRSTICQHDMASALRIGYSCSKTASIYVACLDYEPIPNCKPAGVQPAWGSEIMSTLINLFRHFAYPSQSLLALPLDGFMTCEMATRLFRMGLVHKVPSGGYALTDRGQRLTRQFRRVPPSNFAAAFLLSSITSTTPRPMFDAVLHTVGVLLHLDDDSETLVTFDPKDQGVTLESAGIVAGWARSLVPRGALYTNVAVRDYLDKNFQPEDLKKPIKLPTGTLMTVSHDLYDRISYSICALRKLTASIQSDNGDQVDSKAIEKDLLLVRLHNLVHFTASPTVKGVDVVSGIPFSNLSKKASKDDVGFFAFYLEITKDNDVHGAHGMISVPPTVVYELLKEIFPASSNLGFDQLLRRLRTSYPMSPMPREKIA